MGLWANVLGTTENFFSIGKDKVKFDNSGLTALRTFTFPDLSGALLVKDHTLGAALRSQGNMTGGGTITVSAGGYVKWTTRLIILNSGNGSYFSTNGVFDIGPCPLSGVITGAGGAADATATADGIPLQVWHALYYILPLGSANAFVVANLRIVTYTGALEMPDHWVLVAIRNGDASGEFRFGNGATLLLSQSWTAADQLPTKANLASPTFTGTVGGITAAMVGAPSGSGSSTGTNTGDQSLAGYQPLDPQLTDLAALVYTGNPLKVVQVNAAATGWELATPAAGGGTTAFTLNTQNAAYTYVLSDAGKLVGKDAAVAYTHTIPLNSSVAYPIGTVISVYNATTANLTIAATAGVTLRFAGTTATGSRPVLPYAIGTLTKVATDTWLISGAGIT